MNVMILILEQMSWLRGAFIRTLVLGGPETTVPWEYQRRATGVKARETNNLLEDIMLAFLPLTSRWQMAKRNWLKCVYFDLFP